MSRKRRSSPLEDLMDIASTLPYWVSLILAVISYFVLHHFASQAPTPEMQAGSYVPQNMTRIMFQPFLMAMQYLVPFVFCLGAAISAIKAFKGRRLAEKYVSTDSKQTVTTNPQNRGKPTDAMNWQQFELLVGQAFRLQGYRVIDGGEVGADGGVDVYLKKDGETFFVQCKHWKAKSVGVSVIRELYGVIAAAGVKGGFVVTSGYFTAEAITFSKGKKLGLIDGPKLKKMILAAKKATPESALEEPETTPETPVCPACASSMVKRKARKGANAGNEFWGCSQFPKCRGITQI
ncbi:restriction endonuclease [Neptunomonas qingdaonensis]|uniref:Restriction system protein n=1 Tax=Neptunomonas qingdaonensis TaxID=1045558 RepID=A0A1I2LWN0_9GAMM|nr:restriction endonuclease [Neptunomonas qingdaonensis]SFF83772.1 restriction system protein [Neptunomonas qingdaonensis]